MPELTFANGFRIFWALFLGTVLAGGFRGAWNAENGKRGYFRRERSDTVVWLDPIVFPILIMIYLGLGFVAVRKSGLMIVSMADLFLFISVYFTFLLLLLPILRRYYTARTCATLWLVPVFLYYQPHIIYSTAKLSPVVKIYIPQKVLTVLLFVWATGFVVIFTMQVVSHIRFVRNLRSHSRPVEDEDLLKQWEDMQKEIDYTLPVELRYCSVIGSPLSVGMRKKNKITYLPERAFTEEDAELIFSHELHHIQRSDTHTKFFLRFSNALGWIHPLVWLAVRRAEDDLELSCDEIVLKNADADKRKRYAELLLSIAGDSRGFSTCLSASAKALRYRLKSALPCRDKRLGVVLLFVVMALSSLSAGRIALITGRGNIEEVAGIESGSIAEAEIGICSFWDDGTADGTPITDTDLLSRYISNLEVEKEIAIYEENSGLIGDPCLSGDWERDDMGFMLTDHYIIIYNYKNATSEKYRLCVPTDWEYLRSL